jgi:transketolase
METTGILMSSEPRQPDNQLSQLAINTIRCLAIDAVEKAKSGHPGLPMGAAAMAYVLWTRFLKHNPRDPRWPNRDRFILSPGHGCMLLYSLLYLTGYEVSLDDLKQFRQWGSKTAGHPERQLIAGIETTTGPLGQGFATGVGMAIAEKYLAAHFNRLGCAIVDYNIYGICSDGDLMEGISSEAASLAGFHRLGNLIYLYDDNRVTIEGSIALAFHEDVGKRFEAYGWFVQHVADGNDLAAVSQAFSSAQNEAERPSLIIVRNHIGYGSPNKQDKSASHGAPLGEEEVKLTKRNLGWPLEPPFYVPLEVLSHYREAIPRGQKLQDEWVRRLEVYKRELPDLAAEWQRYVRGELPKDWASKIPVFKVDERPMATRQASGRVLNAIASSLPTLVGGSADLAPSTDTYIAGGGDFGPENYAGRNLHFGVREHGMAAIVNGMSLSGLIAYGGTFLVFSDYCRPSLRLAALMKAHSIFVLTHDSIFLGEDGPTHQPIEHLPALRAIPNLCVIRPADANETAVAWKVAIEHQDGPVALILTRQTLPVIDHTKYSPAEGLARGAYVLAEDPRQKAKAAVIASGSEVTLALAAYEALKGEGISIRVVSMPSWSLFERQSPAYQDYVLPRGIKSWLTLEAASPFGWERYVGRKGRIIGMRTFGASAPYQVLADKFGFTCANVVQQIKELLDSDKYVGTLGRDSG